MSVKILLFVIITCILLFLNFELLLSRLDFRSVSSNLLNPWKIVSVILAFMLLALLFYVCVKSAENLSLG